VPVFAIGGITQNNVQALKDLGVDRVAVCRDILLAQNPAGVIKAFKTILKAQ
jgi:thiamine monophosphate synthase